MIFRGDFVFVFVFFLKQRFNRDFAVGSDGNGHVLLGRKQVVHAQGASAGPGGAKDAAGVQGRCQRAGGGMDSS